MLPTPFKHGQTINGIICKFVCFFFVYFIFVFPLQIHNFKIMFFLLFFFLCSLLFSLLFFKQTQNKMGEAMACCLPSTQRFSIWTTSSSTTHGIAPARCLLLSLHEQSGAHIHRCSLSTSPRAQINQQPCNY